MAKKIPALPKTLGGCADKLMRLRDERQELTKKIDAIKAHENAIKEKLIEELPKDDAQGVTGKLARVTIKTKKVGTVKDWSALYEYIRKKKDFSLLQRRLSDAAVKEQWEAGKKIPGVEPFNVIQVSLTKKR